MAAGWIGILKKRMPSGTDSSGNEKIKKQQSRKAEAGQMAADIFQGFGKLVFNRFPADVHFISDLFHGEAFETAFDKNIPPPRRQPGNDLIQLALQKAEIHIFRRSEIEVPAAL